MSHDTADHSYPGYLLRFFDELALDGADAEEIVRRTAQWSGRAVASRGPDDEIVAFSREGMRLQAWPAELARVQAPQGYLVGIGRPHGEHDAALLDRLTSTLLLERARRTQVGLTMTTSRAVQILTRRDESAETHRRALQRLGLSRTETCRVVVVHGPHAAVEDLVRHLRAMPGLRVESSTEGRLRALLVTGGWPEQALADIPVGLRVAVSDTRAVLDGATALKEARAAFQFAQPSPRPRGPYLAEEGVAVRYAGLRGYDALAEGMTPELIDRLLDVQALDRVLTRSGPDMLATLDVVVSAPSLRSAARMLGTHHNTVSHRVALAERAFGSALTDTYGRSRLFLALTMRRIRESRRILG